MQVKQNPSWVVADLGCGDARLRKSVPNAVVHSFDLVSRDACVTAANLADLPLSSASCDCCVICLALMGVDYPLFLMEASRVLKIGGKLLLAEVASRIDKVDDFVGVLQFIGFQVDVKKQVRVTCDV
jgi:ribosomal RNA-processing protein 8